MKKNVYTLTLLLFFLTVGCVRYVDSAIQGVGVAISYVKTPITLKVQTDHAQPININDYETLQNIQNNIYKNEYKNNFIDKKQTEEFAKQRFNTTRENIPLKEERFDSFQDLIDKKHIVAFCFSGGGTRAATMAAQCMARLEKKYNEYCEHNRCVKKPLIELIDICSSVSGGSIYTGALAIYYKSIENKPEKQRTCFQDLANILEKNWSTPYNLGVLATFDYFNPFNLNIPILTSIFTNLTYTQVFARTLDDSYWYLNHPYSFLDRFNCYYRHSLGDLPQKPRFFLNSACLESGTRMVFSQSMIHFPKEFPLDKDLSETTRLDTYAQLRKDSEYQNYRFIKEKPLAKAMTLENINISVSKYPLAWAVMASAAFPLALDPVSIRKYNYNNGKIVPSSTNLRLVDGGVINNSGLTTVTEIYDYLRSVSDNQNKKFIIVSINAEIEEYQKNIAQNNQENKRAYEYVPISFDFEISRLCQGIESLELIHHRNKKRSDVIALLNMMKSESDVSYFPINLSQLSKFDSHQVNHPKTELIYADIKKLETDFVRTDTKLLNKAIDILFTTEQKHNNAMVDKYLKWDGENRLEPALVKALSISQGE